MPKTREKPSAPARRRVTKAEKQRILRRRRLGVALAVLGFVLFLVVWQANSPVSASQLAAYGWREEMDFGEMSQLNHLLRKYDITSAPSLTMFFASVGAETDNGRLTLEEGGEAYYRAHGYSAAERGAGYLQLTHRSEQLAFLAAVGDDYDGTDTAAYIAAHYPWESACWEWSVGKTAPSPNPNAYARKNGNTLEVFLATQYAVNGWRIDDEALGQIVRGADYTVSTDGAQVTVAGETYPLPIGWPSRAAHYEKAKEIWG